MNKYPKVYEFCKERFETLNEIKRQLKSHTYREANYECLYCDFVSKHTLTMEVHMGKLHTDKMEYGICEIESKDIEALETHLNTSYYQCHQFRKKCKLLHSTILHLSEKMFWSESI